MPRVDAVEGGIYFTHLPGGEGEFEFNSCRMTIVIPSFTMVFGYICGNYDKKKKAKE